MRQAGLPSWGNVLSTEKITIKKRKKKTGKKGRDNGTPRDDNSPLQNFYRRRLTRTVINFARDEQSRTWTSFEYELRQLGSPLFPARLFVRWLARIAGHCTRGLQVPTLQFRSEVRSDLEGWPRSLVSADNWPPQIKAFVLRFVLFIFLPRFLLPCRWFLFGFVEPPRRSIKIQLGPMMLREKESIEILLEGRKEWRNDAPFNVIIINWIINYFEQSSGKYGIRSSIFSLFENIVLEA